MQASRYFQTFLFFSFYLTQLVFSAPAAQAEQITETLRLRGKLQTRWQLSGSDTGSWSESLFVRRARIDGKWTPYDWATLMLELEFGDEVEARDLYIEFEPLDDFEITLGYFKKPFSRVRLDSPWDLLVPDRGLFDAQVTRRSRFGGYGARDMGLMVSGVHYGPTLYQDPLKLKYSVGAFSSLPDTDNAYRDLVGRLQLRLLKGLIVAVNASGKLYDDDGLQTGLMLGGDIKWEWDPFKWVLEGASGRNLNTGGLLWGAHQTLSYEIQLPEFMGLKPRLTPALMFEAFQPDSEDIETLDLRLAAALNLDINKQVRFVLSLDKTWENVYASTEQANPITIFLQNNIEF